MPGSWSTPQSLLMNIEKRRSLPGRLPWTSIVLWALILGGLTLRVIYFYTTPAETWGDTPRYDQIASYWAAGWPVWEPASPLDLRGGFTYPFFLMVVFKIFGHSAKIAAAFQHAIGLMLVPLTYSLGRISFSRPVGLIAAGLVALDPALIRYENRLMTEILFAFLMMLSTWLLLMASQRDALRRSLPHLALSGICLGLAILARPSFQAYVAIVPAILAVAVLSRSHDLHRGSFVKDKVLRFAAMCAVFLLATAAVLLPWVARNYYAYHYAGLSAISGQLYKKTVPFTSPEGNHPVFRRWIQHDITANGNCNSVCGQAGLLAGTWKSGYDWLESNRILGEIAKEDIRRHPVQYLETTWPTLLNMWQNNDFEIGGKSQTNKDDYQINAQIWNRYWSTFPHEEKVWFETWLWPPIVWLAIGGSLWLVIGPAIAWCWHLIRGRPLNSRLVIRLALFLPLLYTVLTTALLSDTGNPRYRIPFDPIVCIFAAAAAAVIILTAAMILQRRWSRGGFRPRHDYSRPTPRL